MDKRTHWFIDTKPFHGEGYAKGSTLRVEAGLLHLQGNERPYFTVTGEIREPRRREATSCGCLHDYILKQWPQLAPVVALHLSDDEGTPMYAEANGLYWLGFGQYSKLDLGIAAKHFRCTEAQVTELREFIMSGGGHDQYKYKVMVDAMRPRWEAEAQAAIALLDSLRAAAL